MLSEKNNIIFVHIPKCGGTSVESAIWEDHEKTEENLWMGFLDKYHNKYQTGGLQHLKAIQIRQHIGRSKFDNFFKFSIVRNPFARIVSQFLYMESRPDLRDYIDMNADDSLITYLHKIQKRSHVQWEQQVSFLYDYKGNLLVDKVIQLEQINSLPEILKNNTPISIERIPRTNTNKFKYHYKDYLCTDSISMITDLYFEDFEAFGYSTSP
ncbi:Sulfotransferase family [Pseudomonas sp. GM74]|uniref:sulfotransferase family 2 domain-containing protein n=1 Tax=Pseudomonas sp. GM74 TaxID=1144336 RepID=UPI0002705ACD|nr:sulfotransferase family 2 domain-containing protein [Pseudomonas sp. GM74]EJM94427.1 Sulfotransferase family [Pseudomonas sp. GM74]